MTTERQTEAERQSAERVDKAARMNDELAERLHQNDVQPGITEKPAPKAKPTPKAADKP
jgi:hypothetical protein